MQCVGFDAEFERREIIVREGNEDRVTVLPENLILRLKMHLEKVKASHERDLRLLTRLRMSHLRPIIERVTFKT